MKIQDIMTREVVVVSPEEIDPVGGAEDTRP